MMLLAALDERLREAGPTGWSTGAYSSNAASERSPGSPETLNTRASRRLGAIVTANAASYSRLMGADEEDTVQRIKAHRCEPIDPKIPKYLCRLVKITGDNMLVEYSSVVDALGCAVEQMPPTGLGIFGWRRRFGLRADLDEAKASLAESLRLNPRIRSLADFRCKFPAFTKPAFWAFLKRRGLSVCAAAASPKSDDAIARRVQTAGSGTLSNRLYWA